MPFLMQGQIAPKRINKESGKEEIARELPGKGISSLQISERFQLGEDVSRHFFPMEFIYIDSASQTLELLVLLSFIMMMYSNIRRSQPPKKRRK